MGSMPRTEQPGYWFRAPDAEILAAGEYHERCVFYAKALGVNLPRLAEGLDSTPFIVWRRTDCIYRVGPHVASALTALGKMALQDEQGLRNVAEYFFKDEYHSQPMQADSPEKARCFVAKHGPPVRSFSKRGFIPYGPIMGYNYPHEWDTKFFNIGVFNPYEAVPVDFILWIANTLTAIRKYSEWEECYFMIEAGLNRLRLAPSYPGQAEGWRFERARGLQVRGDLLGYLTLAAAFGLREELEDVSSRLCRRCGQPTFNHKKSVYYCANCREELKESGTPDPTNSIRQKRFLETKPDYYRNRQLLAKEISP